MFMQGPFADMLKLADKSIVSQLALPSNGWGMPWAQPQEKPNLREGGVGRGCAWAVQMIGLVESCMRRCRKKLHALEVQGPDQVTPLRSAAVTQDSQGFRQCVCVPIL